MCSKSGAENLMGALTLPRFSALLLVVALPLRPMPLLLCTLPYDAVRLLRLPTVQVRGTGYGVWG